MLNVYPNLKTTAHTVHNTDACVSEVVFLGIEIGRVILQYLRHLFYFCTNLLSKNQLKQVTWLISCLKLTYNLGIENQYLLHPFKFRTCILIMPSIK
jgi:hypothetical protein